MNAMLHIFQPCRLESQQFSSRIILEWLFYYASNRLPHIFLEKFWKVFIIIIIATILVTSLLSNNNFLILWSYFFTYFSNLSSSILLFCSIFFTSMTKAEMSSWKWSIKCGGTLLVWSSLYKENILSPLVYMKKE